MKKAILTIGCLLCSFGAFAEDISDDLQLMNQAVGFAAQADTYNVYCGKESNLAQDFIDKFKDNKRASEKELDLLAHVKDKNVQKTQDLIKTDGKGCKDIEFMLARLQVMRALKDVSYLLNGVKKEDIPQDNIPELEQLLPQSSDVSVPSQL